MSWALQGWGVSSLRQGSLGFSGLQLEVSKLNAHIRGESQAPFKELAFCKKCLM